MEVNRQSRRRRWSAWLYRQFVWTVIWSLVLALFPWSPPALTPTMQQALDRAPESAQWIAPLALSITGWADRALAAVGPRPVFAGDSITLTLSKRDDGPNVGPIPVGPDPVSVGGVLVYYVHITNTGVTTATVFFTDVLPSELSCLGAGVTPQNGGAGWFGACAGGNMVVMRTLDSLGLGYGLGPGRSAVLYIQTQVQGGLSDGYVLTNTQTAYSAHATQEPQYVYSGLNDVATTVRAPQLAITKTVSPAQVGTGDLLTYLITYTNLGSVTATGILITDALDANLAYQSATPPPDLIGPPLVWNSLSDLPAGSSGQITLVARVNEGVLSGTLVANNVSISCAEGASASDGPVTATVQGRTVRVSKSVVPTTVRAGERLTYTLVFTNDSSVATSNVYVTDTVPSGVSGVSHSTTDAVFNGQVGNAYGWYVASMSPGQVGVIQLAMNAPTAPIAADGSTQLTNHVQITGAQASATPPFSLLNTLIPGPAHTLDLIIAPAEQLVNYTSTITVTVTDAYGNRVYDGDGYTVTLSSDPASATLGSDTLALSNGQGTTTIMATTSGVYTVTAQVFGTAITDSAQVTFTPGYVHHFLIAPIASPQRAGVDFTITITAVDLYNNVVNTFDASVPIQDGPEPDQMYPDATANFVNGVLSAQVVSITLARPNDPITVGTGLSATASNPFTVIGGLPATLTVQFDNLAVPLGQPAPFTVIVSDTWGNRVQDEPLTLTVDFGSVSPLTATTNLAGIATGNVYSTTTPGWVTLVVTTSNGITNWASVEFIAGCPTTATVVVVPPELSVDQTAAITVTLVDAWNNLVPNVQVNLSAAGLGGGNISPATGTTNADGQITATVTSTLVGVKTISAQTVAAGGCSSISGSGQVTFTHGAPFTLSLSMLPNPQVVGTPAELRADVADQYGNPVPGEVVTFTVTPGTLGGGDINPITGTSGITGRATTNILSTLVGSTMVTATLSSDPAIWRTAAVSFTAGPPTAMTITVAPDSVYGEENATLTITVTDQYGNPSAGYAVNLSANPLGAGGISPNPATANAGGVATALISGTIPGVVYITGTAGTAQATAQMTVTNGPLFSFLTSPMSDVGAGVDFTLHITAVDAWGNPRPQDHYAVSLSDLTGSLQPTSATLVSGTATVVLSITTAMVNDIISVWKPDLPSTITQTNPFTVTAGTPYTVVLTYASPISACTSTPITATVYDRYGNPVVGVPVTFTHSGVGSIAPANATSDGQGRAVTLLTSNQVGTATVQVTAGALAPVTATVVVQPGLPLVDLTAAQTNVAAGQTVVLTVTVVDCGSNPVPNEPIAWTITGGPGVLTPNGLPFGGTTNAAGIITFTFVSTQTGQAQIVASTLNGLSFDSVTITVGAGTPSTITLTATPNSLAPGGTTSTLVAQVRDAYGNPVADGTLVRFTLLSAPTGTTLTPPSGSDVATVGGQATAVLTSGSAQGTAQVAVALVDYPGISTVTEVQIRYNIIYLPLVFKQYPIGDLEVTQITPIPIGTDGLGRTLYEVRVTLRNNGPGPVAGGYWVDLYLNPSSPVGLNVLWHQVSVRGYAWYVADTLDAGGTLVLSTQEPRLPPGGSGHYSYWPGDLAGLSNPQLWAMVDSWGDPPNGAVLEMNETNNIMGPVAVP